MLISYNWLKEVLKFNLTPEELSEKLTFSGIEVESIKKTGELLQNIIVAEIIHKEKHPDADKLSLCKVYDGSITHQVICGAPNCATGQKIAFAPIGTIIGDTKLKKVKIRGIESQGMICSEKELGISEEHDGILVLPEDAPIGQTLDSLTLYSDTIYELEITPNRPDLLGLYGIARDLAAQLNLDFEVTGNAGVSPAIINKCRQDACVPSDCRQDACVPSDFNILIQEPTLCTRYIATIVKDVKVQASPKWLIDKLNAVDIKPINNIVDITNYIMYLFGHPLHAFDKNCLHDNNIIVRNSYQSENFPALDNNTYQLTGNELVIADTKKPVALAGVIGGKNSHITENTTDIVLEAACFNPLITRKTSSTLKIFTDSAYRFERGMAEDTCLYITEAATNLILKLAGGTLIQHVDIYPNPKEKRLVALRPDRARKLLTIDITDEQIVKYMERLGLVLSNQELQKAPPPPPHSYFMGEADRVSPPSPPHFIEEATSDSELAFIIPHYRIDIVKEIDLIEEIIRLHGFDKVADSPDQHKIMDKNIFYQKRGIKNTLIHRGFYEAINISFSDPVYLDYLNLSENDYRRNTVNILNPQGESFSILRSTLLPGLLKNTLLNLNHGLESIKLFEMNKVFTEFLSAHPMKNEKGDNGECVELESSRYIKKEEGFVSEKWRITGVLSGAFNPTYWKEKIENVSFFDVRGIKETIFSYVGINSIDIRPSDEPFYLPNAGFSIFYKEHLLGSMGRLDKKVLQNFDIDMDVYCFDLDLDKVFELANFNLPKFKEFTRFPIVQRDISFIIDENFKLNEVIKSIIEVNPKLIQNVIPFDQFKGNQIPDGSRSLSLNISLASEYKTLTDEQIKNIMKSIIDRLKDKYNIQLR